MPREHFGEERKRPAQHCQGSADRVIHPADNLAFPVAPVSFPIFHVTRERILLKASSYRRSRCPSAKSHGRATCCRHGQVVPNPVLHRSVVPLLSICEAPQSLDVDVVEGQQRPWVVGLPLQGLPHKHAQPRRVSAEGHEIVRRLHEVDKTDVDVVRPSIRI